MNIAVVGTGYVGLVTGACFAEMGNNVVCVDIDNEKINKLKNGEIPIFEPSLKEIVERNYDCGRLLFTTDIKSALDVSEIVFSAVGTPPNDDGSADLRFVKEVAKSFGKYITKYTIFVTKSTVPVGTADTVKEIITNELKERNTNVEFDVVSNPEFLKEGSAVNDFMRPERVVIGCENERSMSAMAALCKPFILQDSNRVIFTSVKSAEMIKYASNSMLATRISFMNEIANLCDSVGANVDEVRKGMGTDSRIGKKFLYAGCGYGGSCFPKDVKALIKTGADNDVDMKVIKAVVEANEFQKTVLFNKIKKKFGHINGLKVGVWGLSFKPNTDDMREATSLVLIKALCEEGAKVNAYDPIVKNVNYYHDNFKIVNDKYDAVNGCDVLVVVTEWTEFMMPDFALIKNLMNGNVIIDGRNIYNRKNIEENGFIYLGIGK